MLGALILQVQPMSNNPEPGRWWSKAISLGAYIAVTLIVFAMLGNRLGLWDFGLGFMMLAAGIILAVIGLVTGIIGIIVSIKKPYPAEKSKLITSTVICLLISGTMFMQFQVATSVPPIHNISTDQNDPPRFNKVLALRSGLNPVEYDSDVLGEQQSNAYPRVQTLQSEMDAQASMLRSIEVLENMGLNIVDTDFDALLVEATATSLLFGFKDDLVVRIRPSHSGSLIDLHSVSRVGQSDLGMNAKRILTFIDSF